jgi:hypothetical protein
MGSKKKGASPRKSDHTTRAQLPAGFTPIEHLGSFWSGRNPGDHFEGKLLSVKSKHFPKAKGYPARDANVYTFEVKGGKKVEITQSGGLGALEDVRKGQSVYIQYLGLKKLKGKQAMREYAVGVK